MATIDAATKAKIAAAAEFERLVRVAAADRADLCYCHGCGAKEMRSAMTPHNGDWYCDGCEATQSEEE